MLIALGGFGILFALPALYMTVFILFGPLYVASRLDDETYCSATATLPTCCAEVSVVAVAAMIPSIPTWIGIIVCIVKDIQTNNGDKRNSYFILLFFVLFQSWGAWNFFNVLYGDGIFSPSPSSGGMMPPMQPNEGKTIVPSPSSVNSSNF